jgi:5-methylcytosine-specific restriction endonuclease McrA
MVKHAGGHRWVIFKQLVFRTYGSTCWLCGHGGARQVDHVESVTEHPERAWELSNCRPAHGSPKNRCPTCLQYCNQLRGAMSPERARRLIAERMAEAGKKTAPARAVAGPAGREW